MLLKENVLKVLDDLYREQTMSKCQTQEECKNLRLGVLKALYTVKEMPTVDAEPIVRCEDCQHSNLNGHCMEVGKKYCTIHKRQFHYDFFCSYGERKG